MIPRTLKDAVKEFRDVLESDKDAVNDVLCDLIERAFKKSPYSFGTWNASVALLHLAQAAASKPSRGTRNSRSKPTPRRRK